MYYVMFVICIKNSSTNLHTICYNVFFSLHLNEYNSIFNFWNTFSELLFKILVLEIFLILYNLKNQFPLKNVNVFLSLTCIAYRQNIVMVQTVFCNLQIKSILNFHFKSKKNRWFSQKIFLTLRVYLWAWAQHWRPNKRLILIIFRHRWIYLISPNDFFTF